MYIHCFGLFCFLCEWVFFFQIFLHNNFKFFKITLTPNILMSQLKQSNHLFFKLPRFPIRILCHKFWIFECTANMTSLANGKIQCIFKWEWTKVMMLQFVAYKIPWSTSLFISKVFNFRIKRKIRFCNFFLFEEFTYSK